MFCSNTKSIFVDIFFCLNLSQSYWISYIDHPTNQILLSTLMFSQKLVLDKQECYLLGNLNINLILDKKEIFSNKKYGTDGQNLPPLTNSYLEFFFSYSLEQLISIPNRVTSKTATLIDHVLTNFSQIVSQCSVIKLGISDDDLVYCSRKTPSLKPDKHKDIY